MNDELSEIFPTINENSEKLHIALLIGGIHGEREVSFMSSKGFIESLTELGYKITPIDMGRDICSVLEKVNPDVIFNGLHGGYGEDGTLPAILDMMGIPYTHSGVLSSAIGFNKIISKLLFKAAGMKSAEYFTLKKTDPIVKEPMKPPYVIKPVSEGSSLGVFLIFPEDNFDFRDYKWEYGDEIIIEKYVKGREIQVAIVEDKAVGALEIIPQGRFYDYDSKYDDEKAATHIMPANITADAYKKVLSLAEQAHKLLMCKTISRVEFLYEEQEDEFYILEVNTHPGMTPLSIVPEIAAYNGISYSDVLEILIKDAIKTKN